MTADDDAARAQRLLADLDPSVVRVEDPEPLRRIGLALRDVQRADADLRLAVDHARREGYSWAAIGLVLGTTRQAAQARFGSTRARQ